MNHRGFSLMGMMIAVAVMGIVVVGMMQIVNGLNSTLVFANASNEVNNQLYELRVGLSDPNTCFQNLGVSNRVNFTNGTVALTQPIRYLNGAGALDMATAILPIQSQTPALKAHASRIRIYRQPASPNLAIIDLEFTSPTGFSGQVSVYRRVPLTIATDGAGNLTACSTGSPAIGSSASAAGNCDAALPNPSMRIPAASLRRASVARACGMLTFPTGSQPPQLNCMTLGLTSGQASGWGLGGSSAASLGSGDPLFPSSCFGATGRLGSAFANLPSRQACLDLPAYPSGTSFPVASDTTFACVAGVWTQTAYPFGTGSADSGGDAGGSGGAGGTGL